MKKHFVAAAIALSAIAALAQQTPTADSKPQLSWRAAPAPEIQRLSNVLAGRWRTTEKFEPNEFLRNGGAGTGTFSIRKGPGGNSLVLDYTSRSSMGPYSSSRIIYWDNRERQYRAFYCDSLQPTGCGEAGTGRLEGNDLVFESTTHGPGGILQMTQRFADISGTGFTISLDLVNQGKTERSLTIQARGNGASASAVGPSDVPALAQQAAIADSNTRLSWVAEPAPEILRLSNSLMGKWRTSEKFEPDQSHKNGATGTGTFFIRKGPGGNSLILDYTSRSSMGQYSSSRIIYWDNRERQYRAFYCDSLQSTGCGGAGTGQWEDNDLVFESMIHGPDGLAPIIERFSNISDAAFTFSLNFVNRGKTERSLTIEARKNGARP